MDPLIIAAHNALLGITEAKLRTKYDNEYTALIKQFQSALPWDKKVKKSRSSAQVEYTGEINGKSISLSLHEPDTKWSDNWNFMGLYVLDDSTYKQEVSFNKTFEGLFDEVNDKTQRANIAEMSKAVAHVKSGKAS